MAENNFIHSRHKSSFSSLFLKSCFGSNLNETIESQRNKPKSGWQRIWKPPLTIGPDTLYSRRVPEGPAPRHRPGVSVEYVMEDVKGFVEAALKQRCCGGPLSGDSDLTAGGHMTRAFMSKSWSDNMAPDKKKSHCICSNEVTSLALKRKTWICLLYLGYLTSQSI